MTKIKDLHAKWMKDENYRREYEALVLSDRGTRKILDLLDNPREANARPVAIPKERSER
jgi:hypothetical protein